MPTLYDIFPCIFETCIQFVTILITSFTDRKILSTKQIIYFSYSGPFQEDTLARLQQEDIKNKVQNTSKATHTTMLPETRILIDRFYQPFNDLLSNLLGNEKFKWL